MSEIEQQQEDGPKVIQNSDYLHVTPMQMIDPIEPTEINQFEKDLLKGTITPAELIESEKEEKKPLSKADIEYLSRREYITKVKVIGLHRMGKHPLYNGSLLKPREKEKLKVSMEKIMMLTDDQIQREFNDICIDNLFDSNTDYSTYPVYDPLTMRTNPSREIPQVEDPHEEALNRNYR
jgi:hypothetical protein